MFSVEINVVVKIFETHFSIHITECFIFEFRPHQIFINFKRFSYYLERTKLLHFMKDVLNRTRFEKI